MSRSPALPYAAVTVLALLTGVSNGIRQYLPLLLHDSGMRASELSGYLLGMTVVSTLFVPVGGVVVGYVLADGLDVERRLGVTVVVAYVLAVVGYLVGFSLVVVGAVPVHTTGSVSPFSTLLAAGVVGLTNGLGVTVSVVAGAAVRRLQARPATPDSAV